MAPEYYPIVLLVCEIGVAATATLTSLRRDAHRQLVVGIATAGMLALLGWLDWRAQISKETPIHVYLVFALLPTSLCFVATYLLVQRKVRVGWVFLVAIGLAFLSGAAALLSTFI